MAIIDIENTKNTKKLILKIHRQNAGCLQEGDIPKDIKAAYEASNNKYYRCKGREYHTHNHPTKPIDSMLNSHDR